MSTRQLITRIAMAIVIVCGTATTAKAQLGRLLEISFDYQVQPGPGSNQFAVWIENTNGEVVKTIFVTSYTTKGRARGEEKPKRGYLVRPNCVPKWVKIAKPDTKLDVQLDAVTGATPKENGTQTFVWDFRDDLGKPVPKGNYRVYVEGTLFFESDVVYSAMFNSNEKGGNLAVNRSLAKPDPKHNDMITNVKVVLK